MSRWPALTTSRRPPSGTSIRHPGRRAACRGDRSSQGTGSPSTVTYSLEPTARTSQDGPRLPMPRAMSRAASTATAAVHRQRRPGPRRARGAGVRSGRRPCGPDVSAPSRSDAPKSPLTKDARRRARKASSASGRRNPRTASRAASCSGVSGASWSSRRSFMAPSSPAGSPRGPAGPGSSACGPQRGSRPGSPPHGRARAPGSRAAR